MPFTPDLRYGIEQGIANARMEGLVVAEEDAAILERCAKGEISASEAKALILARHTAQKANRNQGR